MMDNAPVDVSQLMAGIVDNRIRMWELIQEVSDRPDEAVMDRLRSGAWIDDMRDAVQWLGESAERFSSSLVDVEEAVGDARGTLQNLAAAHDAIVARQRISLTGCITDLLGQLAAERRAWVSGDDEYAKTLRLAEHDQLHTRMVPAVQQWTYDALHQQESPVLASLTRVVTVVLSMETGRDFERRRGKGEFSIADDLP